MKLAASKNFIVLKWLVELNFYLSVFVLLAGGILAISDNGSVFEFNADLYGPLANNLRIMMIYLALTECIMAAVCFFSGNTQFFMLVGLSLLLLTGSLQFYSVINVIEVDPNFSIFFIYTGLSHLAYGLWAYLLKAHHSVPQTRSRQS